MSKLIIPDYNVIRDTREKKNHGWIFEKHAPKRRPPRCLGYTDSKLDTGDYSVQGYEDILTIERKYGLGELWINYLSGRDRFENECARMSEIKYRAIIIETFLSKEIMEFSPPQVKTFMPGRVIVKWLTSLSLRYNIPVYFDGELGKKRAQYIFEEAIREERDRWTQK